MNNYILKLIYHSRPRLVESLFSIIVMGWLASSIAPNAHAGTQAVSVMIQQSESPVSLNSTFNGFSYDKDALTMHLVSVDNAALVALYRQLGPGVLRTGGNGVEQITWDPDGPGYTNDKISRVDIDRVAAFLRATNWKIIYGLNFSIGTPPVTTLPSAAAVAAAALTAAQEAAYVASAFGDNLIGFEIGNEPGEFAKNGMRPASYTFADYEAEWESFAKAIRDEVPSAVLIGPADQSYTPPFISSLGSKVGLITDHYYHGTGQGSDYLQQLLTIDPYLAENMLPTVYSLSKAIPVGYRMGECNAFTQPLRGGEANVFAEALWGIDFEFVNALNHSTGVNFQTIAGLSPIDTSYSNGTVTSVNSLYYGMKLFSMAANGTLLRTAVSAQQTTVSAYAVAGKDGFTYVVLSNKDAFNTVDASIEFMEPISSATSILLTAPSLTSATGVTLGGAPIGIDGSWSPSKVDSVKLSNGAAIVTIPAGSAALIKALPSTTDPPPQTSSSIVTVSYDNLCMDIWHLTPSVGPYVQQHACTGELNQSFAFASTADGYYTVFSNMDQLCLDAPAGDSTVIQNICSGAPSQKWQLKNNSDGTYTFLNANSRNCLGIPNASTTSGALFEVSACEGETSQKLELATPPTALVQPH